MDNRMSGISTKVGASAAGGAAATILWALLALVWGAVREMDPQALAALTGATATLLAFALGYLVPETAIIDQGVDMPLPPPDEVIIDPAAQAVELTGQREPFLPVDEPPVAS